jgi:hypothetical protein
MAENYIRAGFLADLLEPWQYIEGSEWGGQIVAMHELASRCLGIDDDRAVIVTGWMMDEFSRAFEEDWWGDLYEYLPEIIKARDTYPRIVEAWRKRARSFDLPPSQNVPNGVDASGAFEATLASLPEWMKPANEDDRKRAVRLELLDKKHRLEMDLAAINRQINDGTV